MDDEAARDASAACDTANALLQALTPAVLDGFRSALDVVALPLVPFISAYVGRLKTLHKRCVRSWGIREKRPYVRTGACA